MLNRTLLTLHVPLYQLTESKHLHVVSLYCTPGKKEANMFFTTLVDLQLDAQNSYLFT